MKQYTLGPFWYHPGKRPPSWIRIIITEQDGDEHLVRSISVEKAILSSVTSLKPDEWNQVDTTLPQEYLFQCDSEGVEKGHWEYYFLKDQKLYRCFPSAITGFQVHELHYSQENDFEIVRVDMDIPANAPKALIQKDVKVDPVPWLIEKEFHVVCEATSPLEKTLFDNVRPLLEILKDQSNDKQAYVTALLGVLEGKIIEHVDQYSESNMHVWQIAWVLHTYLWPDVLRGWLSNKKLGSEVTLRDMFKFVVHVFTQEVKKYQPGSRINLVVLPENCRHMKRGDEIGFSDGFGYDVALRKTLKGKLSDTQQKLMMSVMRFELSESASSQDYMELYQQLQSLKTPSCATNIAAQIDMLQRSLWRFVICRNDADLLNLLLDECQIDCTLTYPGSATGLHMACSSKSENSLSCLLEKEEIDLTVRNKFSRLTLLHLVADQRLRDDILVALLNTKKIPVNVRGKAGITPLHMAALKGNQRAVELLVAAGAELAVMDQEGATPLHYAIVGGSGAVVQFLLNYAKTKHIAGFDIGIDTGWQLAMQQENIGPLEMLLTSTGYPVTLEKEQGEAALLWAVREKKPSLVKVLLEKVPPSKDYNGEDFSPLHVSVSQGSEDITEQLVDKGFTPNVLDRFLTTPLFYAVESRNEYLFFLLLSVGAQIGLGGSSIRDTANINRSRQFLHHIEKLAKMEKGLRKLGHTNENAEKGMRVFCKGLCESYKSRRESGVIALHIAMLDLYLYFLEKALKRFSDRAKHKERYAHFCYYLSIFEKSMPEGFSPLVFTKLQFSSALPGNFSETYFSLFEKFYKQYSEADAIVSRGAISFFRKGVLIKYPIKPLETPQMGPLLGAD